MLNDVLKDLRAGKMIILVDGEDRENEGDLICAAELVTPEVVNFMARFGRGLICVPMSQKQAERLSLEALPHHFSSRLQSCNFTISVDAHEGITTGISAHDRAHTIRLLADSKTKPSQLSRPGHVFPLVANQGGIFARQGHTEATVELLRRAGVTPVGVLCEIIGDDGYMLRGTALKQFAKRHKIKIYSIAELIEESKKHDLLVERDAEARLPTEFGEFRMVVYKNKMDTKEHLALVMGKISQTKPMLVRVHSECLTGDIFHSRRCDCNEQLHLALKLIGDRKSGILLYMRHEGRGIGLANKLRAYNLQDEGLDTVEANEKLGFKADAREYSIAAHILKDLGAKRIELATNNPHKVTQIQRYGISIVKRTPMEVELTSKELASYMKTKKNKLRHILGNN